MIRNANDIIEHADILSVVQRHLVTRKANGKWTAQCPWHDATAKSTAFTINPDKNTWYCFGCGAGGSTLAFLAVVHGMTSVGGDLKGAVKDNFAALVEILSGYTGDTLEYDDAASAGPRRGDIHDCLAAVQDHYARSLPDKERSTLHQRGFTDALIQKYGIGYAPGNSAHTLGHTPAILEAAGVAKKSPRTGNLYDPLHDRITIPLHDHIGRVIAFTGRATAPDQQPKYLNTADTRVYQKGAHLFNLHRIPPKTEIIHSIEGQLKAIALHEAGHACISPGGTSLTDRAIAQLQGCEVRIVPDPDQAGRKAALKHITRLRAQQIPAFISIVIPDDDGKHLKDPDDYLAAGRPFTVTTIDWLAWLWETFAEPLDLEAQAAAVSKTILPVVAAHPDPLVVDQTTRRLAAISDYRLADLRRGIAARPPETQRPEPLRDPAPKTTAQVLVAIVVNLPVDPENPNHWTQSLHWTSYPPELLSCLREIADIRDISARYRLEIPQTLELRPPSRWSSILYTYATIPIPFPCDRDGLLKCDQRLHSEHTIKNTQETLPC